jgi:hypothetical protein
MNLGAALGASLLAVLATPATWVLGLLSFLLRGGLLVVLLPIVTVPSAVGIGNLLGPALTALVLGDTMGGLLVVSAAVLLVLALWLGICGWIAAAAEAESIRLVAEDEEVGAAPAVLASTPRVAGRILVARLLSMLPLLIALAVGGVQVVGVAYRELTVPTGSGAPLVTRVAAGAAESLALILVAWLVGEALGALAARYVALGGRRVLGALWAAIVDLVRHPLAVLFGAILPLATLLVVLVPTAVATGAAWSALRTVLIEDDGTVAAVALVALLVVLWLGGLVLIGLVSAWRGAVWTVLVARTFGGVRSTRPGEWSGTAERGTLTGLRPDGADQDSR